MSARSLRSSRDLAATVALALVGLLAGLLPAPEWLRFLALAPMAFLLPGYAAAAALYPPAAIPSSERTVYVVALSVAISTLSAVAVQLVVPLGRVTWTILLFAVVCAIASAAMRRRRSLPLNRPEPRLVAPRVDPASVVAILAAVAMAGWAISLSSEGAHEEREAIRFAELWALPEPSPEPGAPEQIAIGVGNEEGETTSFLVRARLGGAVVGEWELRLADGERWQTAMPAPPLSEAEPLRVTLLKEGQGYRRVRLRSVP